MRLRLQLHRPFKGELCTVDWLRVRNYNNCILERISQRSVMPHIKNPVTFGAVMSRIRADRGWTAYRLAKEAGLPIQTVLRIEQGTAPKWPTVLKLATALGVSLEAF